MSVEIQPKIESTQVENKRTLRSLINDFEKQGAFPALISFRANTSDTISYGALLQSIRQVAAGFAERGLKQGDSVVFFAPNSSAWVINALAVIYFGGVTVPMDSQQSDEVLKHIVEDSKARFICTNAKGAERLATQFKKKGPEVILLDSPDDKRNWKNLLVPALPPSALPELKADDFTLLFYTSGTTGMPKGAPLTHTNILLQLDSVISKTDLLRPGDRVLLPLPFFHVYPLNIGLFAPFLMGLPIILPRSLTGPEIKRAINEGKVTVVIGVPRLLRSLYQAIEAKFYAHKVVGWIFDFMLFCCGIMTTLFHIKFGKFLFKPVHNQLGPTLRMFTSGGAPLEAPMAAKFRALGFDLACGYGLTETSPLLALRMPNNNDIEGAGEPISGVEMRIMPLADEDNKGGEVKKGQGEIQARGPNVFSGYRNLPDKTKECFTEDGWFKTGDLGYFKGKQLHIVGRASSTIVMEGGEKIQPDDIEDKLAKLPGISEIGLLQKDHKLVALVVPDAEAGKEQASREAIAGQLKQAGRGMASYLAITDFALTSDPLPRTNLGKIKRFELGDMYDKAKGNSKVKGKGGKSSDKLEAGADSKMSAAAPEAKETDKNSSSAKAKTVEEKGAAAKNGEPIEAKESEAGKQKGADDGNEKSPDAAAEKHNEESTDSNQSNAKDNTLLDDPAAQKCFDWLKSRFPDQDITFDTSPQMDLGIDSLEWMNLTFELLDQTGVELSQDAIGKITTVRDLLTEVTNASQGSAGEGADDDDERVSPIEDPESYLDDKQKSYVQPNTPANANRARWLYDLILSTMRPFDVEAIGLDKLPEGQFILTPNHASYIDAFAIIAVMPWARMQRTQWAGWVGIAYANPVFSYFSRLGQVIPIDAQHSLVKSLALSALALKNNKNLVWFPEGERALHGKLLDFKPGIGMLVEKIDVPVVPVFLEGTAKALPPGHYWPTRHKLRVYFGDPVDAQTLAAEGKKLARSQKGAKGKDLEAGQDKDMEAGQDKDLEVGQDKESDAGKNKEAGKDKDKEAGKDNDKERVVTDAELIALALRARVQALADEASNLKIVAK